MLRYLPTPLGVGLIVAGLSVITSPRTVLLLLAGTGAVLALLIALAVARRKRSGEPREQTASEEISRLREFEARRRRSAPWESAFYLLIAVMSVWLEGLTLGTILIVAGVGFLLISRWLVEPHIWAENHPEVDRPPDWELTHSAGSRPAGKSLPNSGTSRIAKSVAGRSSNAGFRS